jgi:hypothetical protein
MKRILAIALAAASLVGGVTVARAANIPLGFSRRAPQVVSPRASQVWSCSTGSFFLDINGALRTSANLSTWKKVGRAGDPLNALAYSPDTHGLYGLDVKTGANLDKLVQLSKSGAQTVLGPITGLPAQLNWNGADIDPATGIYYVSTAGSNLYAVNLLTRVAHRVLVPSPASLGYDIVIQQGWVWSVTPQLINGFSLTTGATKQFLVPGNPHSTTAGSIWADALGDGLYYRWDATGVSWHVTGLRTPSLTFTQLGTVLPKGSANDGATCSAAATPSPDTAPALTVSGDPTGSFVPGAVRKINLTISNSYGETINLDPKVIKVALADSSTACPAFANFTVPHGLTVAVSIPANSTVTLASLGVPSADWPVVQMLETYVNQDACEGTTLTVTYSVRYSG